MFYEAIVTSSPSPPGLLDVVPGSICYYDQLLALINREIEAEQGAGNGGFGAGLGMHKHWRAWDGDVK